MKRLLTLWLLFFTLVAKSQTKWDSIKVVSQQVRDNIYMLQGSGGNIGVIVGKDGVAMIDDQFLPLGEKIKNAIALLDSNSIKFTINTHIHGDHSGSNEYFRQQGSTIIAHDVVRERMKQEQFSKFIKTTSPPRVEDAWPVITFPRQMNLHLNGQDIELIHFGPGHTDGDLIIRFKQANVFHMGDVFVTYGYPYLDMSSGGSINGLINTLDQAMALMDDQSKVIPGHGSISTKADVKKYRDYLADIRDKVAAAIKKGKKAEDLTGLGITDKYDAEWGKSWIKGKDFVLIVAEGLVEARK